VASVSKTFSARADQEQPDDAIVSFGHFEQLGKSFSWLVFVTLARTRSQLSHNFS
jgi:hypothetical protein